MFGPYVHHIDPIIAEVGGVYLWWYGLGYSLGFLHLHLFLRRHRLRLGLTSREAYTLSLFIVVGVLAGARIVEVIFDEWPFYRANPALIPAYWLGAWRLTGSFSERLEPLLALGTGQSLNIVMALIGVVLLIRSRLRRQGRLRSGAEAAEKPRRPENAPLASQRVAFVLLLVFCLTLPSNWTQNVPERYGDRHAGLEHSWLYPDIDTSEKIEDP